MKRELYFANLRYLVIVKTICIIDRKRIQTGRIFTKCNILEDHLLPCDINREIREQLFEQIEHEHPFFRHLNTKDLFIYLVQHDDTNVCPLIQRFIVVCLKASYDLKRSLGIALNAKPL